MYDTANPPRTGRSDGTTNRTSADDVFDALSATRRREVLAVLTENGPLEIERLAMAVATEEADGGVVDETRVEEVHTTLHHVHLPKLSDVGLVAYDREDGTVVATTDHVDVPGFGVEGDAFDDGS